MNNALVTDLYEKYGPVLKDLYGTYTVTSYKERRIISIRMKDPKHPPFRINQIVLLTELKKVLSELGIPPLGCQLTFNDTTPKDSIKYRFNIEILFNHKIANQVFS